MMFNRGWDSTANFTAIVFHIGAVCERDFTVLTLLSAKLSLAEGRDMV